MKIGIMQPYFFPYLGYWQLINAVDRYVVYDDVDYIKGGWINRNNILLNGASHMITLSLVKSSSYRKINEIEITNDKIALGKIIKTIKSAYQKAPYYNQIMPLIERLIMESRTIAILNYNSIIEIGKYLSMDTEIILSSDIKKNNELKGEEKVLHINKLLGADSYYNAIGGKKLYSKDYFKENGIGLFFLKMGNVAYKQYSEDFVSGLSIIDILMFNDVCEIKRMLDLYELE